MWWIWAKKRWFILEHLIYQASAQKSNQWLCLKVLLKATPCLWTTLVHARDGISLFLCNSRSLCFIYVCIYLLIYLYVSAMAMDVCVFYKKQDQYLSAIKAENFFKIWFFFPTNILFSVFCLSVQRCSINYRFKNNETQIPSTWDLKVNINNVTKNSDKMIGRIENNVHIIEMTLS